MRIGLINIEPKIINTAYMQIAAYHRAKGDTINWWMPLSDGQFDHVYCSSLFDFTDTSEIPQRAIRGGTGFDVHSRLSKEIEKCDYDYSIYPKCDYSIVWFSRGCIRKCGFCCVPEKEGKIQPVAPKKLNPKGKYIVVQDNNFFASPLWESAIKYLQCFVQPVDFQGVDVRLLNKKKCEALLNLKHFKQIKIAWDDPKDNDLYFKIKEITRYIPAYKLMCYVLIGFNSQEWEDIARIDRLRDLGIDPFVMPYNKNNQYQRSFSRWVNHKAIFKKVSWTDYRNRVDEQEAVGNGWKRG